MEEFQEKVLNRFSFFREDRAQWRTPATQEGGGE
jgi:hypothetical protein